jgi:hypothetical protein
MKRAGQWPARILIRFAISPLIARQITVQRRPRVFAGSQPLSWLRGDDVRHAATAWQAAVQRKQRLPISASDVLSSWSVPLLCPIRIGVRVNLTKLCGAYAGIAGYHCGIFTAIVPNLATIVYSRMTEIRRP